MLNCQIILVEKEDNPDQALVPGVDPDHRLIRKRSCCRLSGMFNPLPHSLKF